MFKYIVLIKCSKNNFRLANFFIHIDIFIFHAYFNILMHILIMHKQDFLAHIWLVFNAYKSSI